GGTGHVRELTEHRQALLQNGFRPVKPALLAREQRQPDAEVGGIAAVSLARLGGRIAGGTGGSCLSGMISTRSRLCLSVKPTQGNSASRRSEEHTSELQSLT